MYNQIYQRSTEVTLMPRKKIFNLYKCFSHLSLTSFRKEVRVRCKTKVLKMLTVGYKGRIYLDLLQGQS